MSFKDHFSKLAAGYASYRPHYPAALFDYFLELTPSRQCAWDCACGSGQATLELAARFERVMATDASARQIAAAPAHPRITYRVATAEQSGLAAASIDLLAVAQALHWFDLRSFYGEARRVLRPGGVIAAWTYGVATVEGVALDRIARRFYDMLDPWWPPERSLVESGYRTLPFPFDEVAPRSFILQVRWSLPQLLGYFRSWSAVGRYIDDRGEDPVEPLRAELLRDWGDPAETRLVTWPLAMRVGRHER